MKNYIISLSTAVVLVLFGFSLPHAIAGAQASIKIEQLSPSSYGTWTLLAADGTSRSSADKGVSVTGNMTAGITDFGQMTLSVVMPPGMSVSIIVYRGNEFVTEVKSTQYSFPIFPNDNYRFVITYSLSRLGSLGITSEPSNVRFRMKGPSGRNYTAKSPFTFKKLPAGTYSLYFPKTEGCLQPAVQTIDVQPEERNTKHITLPCTVEEDVSVDRSRVSKRTLFEYVKAREIKKRGERK
jgi:hypothetical protein